MTDLNGNKFGAIKFATNVSRTTRRSAVQRLFPTFCSAIVLAGVPTVKAWANCTGTTSIVCDASSPNPYTTTVGTGKSTPQGTSVNVESGATVNSGDASAISVTSNSTITVSGTVENAAVHNFGLYGTGGNTIDFGANSTLIVEAGGQVLSTGQQSQAEAVNLEGSDNAIDNFGTISAAHAAAIWFQQKTGTNTVINETSGVIETDVPNGSVIGGGFPFSSNVDFINKGAVVGNIIFGSGNDVLSLFTGSSVTGSIDGGAGTNALNLDGTGTDSMSGAVTNFGSLIKGDTGTWTLTGVVGDNGGTTPLAVDVNSGTLVLTGDNASFNGTTTVDPAGTLQLGNGGTSGGIAGDVADNGTLAFDRSDAVTFAGVISGSGGVSQIGTGTTTLNVDEPYMGPTSVTAGKLIVGDASNPGAALSGGGTATVAAGATLGGYGRVAGDVINSGTVAAANAVPDLATGANGNFSIGGTLTNAGLVQIAGTGTGNTLTTHSYIGQGGTVALNTYLGTDNSPTDELIINGGTATGTTTLKVTNTGGPGALTTANGIEVVAAENGATTQASAFSLAGTSVRAGAYDYRLFQGGLTASNSNFYLRSTFVETPVTPAMPIIGPELSAYGAVTPTAQQMGMNSLGTLYDRVGDETISNDAGSAAYRASAVWGRAFGGYIGAAYGGQTRTQTSGSEAGMQVGIDLYRHIAENGGRNFFGTYFSYANTQVGTSGLVTNPAATAYDKEKTGNINLNGYSGGLYYTHFGPSGWYVDSVAEGTSYTGSASSTRTGINLTGFGLSASLEVGDPLALTSVLYLEPQAQLIWEGVWFNRTQDAYGSVQPGEGSTLYGRIGAQLNWNTGTSDWLLRPYARANLWSALVGTSSEVTYSGVDSISTKADAAWTQLGVGITAQRADTKISYYAHVDGLVGLQNSNTNRYGVDGSAGLKWSW